MLELRKDAQSKVVYGFVLLGLISLLFAWQIRNLGSHKWLYDEAGYVAVPWMVAAGHTLYTEVYSPSPPLFTLSVVVAFKVWGNSVEVARAVIVAYSALGLLAAALLAREIRGRVAGLAAVLLLFFSPEYFRLSRVTMSEVPAASLALISLVASLVYWRRGRKGWLILSGLALAASLLVKLVTLFALPLPIMAVVLHHLSLPTPSAGRPMAERVKGMVPDLALWAVSFCLPILLCLLIYDPRAMYEQAVALHWRGRGFHPIDYSRRGPRILGYLWQDRGLLMLALGGSLSCWLRRSRQALLVVAWFLLVTIMMVNQSPLTTHHMLSMVPPLAVLAGVTVQEGWVSWLALIKRRHWRGAILPAVSVGLVAFYLVNWPAVAESNREEMARTNTPNELVEDAISLLKQVTAPGDFVISDDPLIVLLAGRSIPPTLTGADWRRLSVGYLTAEQLVALSEKYDASALVFWRERFDNLSAYVQWVEARFEAVEIGVSSHRLYLPPEPAVSPNITFGRKIQLLASRVDETHLASTGQLKVTLFWRALQPVGGDYTIYLKLINPVYRIWGQQDSRPYHDGSLTWTWQEGQVIYDPRQLELLPGTPPGQYQIEIIPVEIYSTEALEADMREPVLVGPVEVPRRAPPPAEALDIEHPLVAELGGKVRLLGYNIESGFRPGDGIHLTLFWQCLKEMDEKYTVFTHLIGGKGHIWGQKDNEPADGFYPTTEWRKGEIVRDQYDLTIPRDAPPGEHQIEVGMYLAETGERLPVLNVDGQVEDNQVLLGTVWVEEP
ncbi:MAG: phospholipid carrier-dependent glycosyltransferase [Anaerolineales bacterium]|nr:MAG: phospholipid carrier-dependent glycosyltransferase [Anaerolineales bacterium]